MSYTDEYTDKELTKLENKIKKEYKKAYAEMANKCADYFDELDVRYKAQAESGAYDEKELADWYQAQVQRGKQWESVRDEMAYRLSKSNEIASDYINSTTPKVYTENGNYEAYSIARDTGVEANFRLINEDAVRNLVMDEGNYTEFRTVRTNPQRDYEWNSKQIQSAVTSAILQGKTPAQTTDAFLQVMKRNRASAIRNARTAMTSAQNAGRVKSMEQAKDLGIDIRKKWVATNDERTRFSHAMLNGQIRDIGSKFSNGLEYPSDSAGAPAEVYNCRCTLTKVYPKYEQQESNEKYEDWLGLSEEEQKADLKAYEKWQKEMQDKVAKKEEYKPDNTIISNQQKEANNKKKSIVKNEFNFTPAKTIQEAEEFAKTLVDDTQFGAIGVSFKGVSLEVANTVNKTIAEFQNTFDVSKLGGISAPAKNTKLGKMLSGAKMGYIPIRNSLVLNKDTCKSLKFFAKECEEELSMIASYMKNPSSFTFRTIRAEKVAKASIKSGRATVPMKLYECVWHELGHSLEKKISKSDNYSVIKENMSKYAENISGYATSDISEYIAESFCSYMKGESVIDSELSKVFDSFRR